MSTVHLTCPEGHSWDHPDTDPVPADVRTICPACLAMSASPVPPATVTPGRVVEGFEILEEINRGGMGIIYKARQIAMNRLVALKAITPAKLELPGVRERFMREVQASALLNHQNIVTVFHTDLDGAFPYLAMEYVPGIDLLRLVKKVGPLPVTDAVYYIRQAAEGLQHAFEQGLIHRDVKPSNLMVSPGPIGSEMLPPGRLPKVKILDMGLARVVSSDGKDSEQGLTQHGVFLGTPDYVSPEQAEDAQNADTRSDIFSLGGALYFLLTAGVPYPGKTLVEKVRKAISGPPSLLAKRMEVPPSLDGVVRKMLAPDPADRYQTPGEVVAALDRILRGEKVPGLPEAPPVSAPLVALGDVKAHDGAIRGLAINSDGQFLVTAGEDSRLRVWQAGNLHEIRSFLGDFGAVDHLALAPGGKWVATCATRLTTSEMGVQLWDLASGAERRRLRGPAENIRCVAISPDGKGIAAGANDSMVWVWSSDQSGPKTFCMKGHSGPVTGLWFTSADSLLSASTDGTVRQWDLRSGKTKGTLRAEIGPINDIAYGSKRVAVAGDYLGVRQPVGSKFRRFTGHTGTVLCAAFSPDGRLLASGGVDKMVRVWSTEDAAEIAAYAGHTNSVLAVAFAPSGKALYSAGQDGMLRRWAVPVV
jgi:eukaryotic-like serine/threonine-protein kinase